MWAGQELDAGARVSAFGQIYLRVIGSGPRLSAGALLLVLVTVAREATFRASDR